MNLNGPPKFIPIAHGVGAFPRNEAVDNLNTCRSEVTSNSVHLPSKDERKATSLQVQRWRRESKHSDKWKLCDTNPGLRPEKAG